MTYPEFDIKMESPKVATATSSDPPLHSQRGELLSQSHHQRTELQKDLNRISSLGDLFIKQSQTLAMMGSEEHGGYMLVGSSVSFESPARSSTTGVDTVGSLGSSDMANGRSFEEELDVRTEGQQLSSAKATQEASPTSVAEATRFLESSFADLERILNFDDVSEDVDSTAMSSMDGSDSDIQAAINELRKEASQMDIIMALDSLKTVEAELQIATRALRERAAQADDLREQLEQKQERMASLELERDLYKADASKLKDDLKTCVERMFDISAVAGSSVLPKTTTRDSTVRVERHTPDDHAVIRSSGLRAASCTPPVSHSSPPDSRSLSGKLEHSQKLFHSQKASRGPLISNSDPSASNSFYIQKPSEADAFPLLGSPYSHEIFRRYPRSSSIPSPEGKSDSTRSMSTQSPPVDRAERQDAFSDETTDSKRRCGLFRRRSSKQSLTNAKEVISMGEQIDQLHTMMKISLQTSEKLRKRLSIISRYYEGIIKKLQQQMVEVKTEYSKRKADMDSKMAILDHEKRVAVLHLESQLQQRDSEIRALKEKLHGSKYEI